MSGPAPIPTNPYTAQLAEQQARRAAQRLAEVDQRIREAAPGGAFASLMQGLPAEVSRRGIEHLANAATRRLSRWTHPVHGGLDDDDRADLLRQATIMGLSPAVATRTLDGVEAAFKARLLAAPPSPRRRWGALHLPTRRWMHWTGWILAALLLLISQALVVWLWLTVLGE